MDIKKSPKIPVVFCLESSNDNMISSMHNNHQHSTLKTPRKSNIPKLFECITCDYITSSVKDYRKHCLTAKHRRKSENIEKIPGFICNCGKQYRYNSGLWKHKKQCYAAEKNPQDIQSPINSELILKVIEQNKELTSVIIEQNKTIHKLFDNKISTNNTQINNNSNNKTFNLNVFLNETCKNAIDIDQFIDNITLSLEDLEYTGRKGYTEGISNIILKNLKRLGEYDRPIHCSDFKREILYIKRNNIWHKEDENKPILVNAIKIIANENIKQISKWKEEYPDCTNSDSKKNNLYLKIVSNSMSGSDKEETNKNIHKIMSNVIKEVTINKK